MKKPKTLQHWILIDILLVIFDVLSCVACYFFALWVRFDFKFSNVWSNFYDCAKDSILYLCLFTILACYIFKLYSAIWRFASIREFVRCAITALTIAIFNVLLTLIFFIRMPISYYLIGFMLQFLCLVGIRFSYRFHLALKSRLNKNPNTPVMVIGAGEAGVMIAKDINDNLANKNDKVVCFIDDNPNKWGRYIGKIPVVGDRNKIDKAISKYYVKKIIVALPSAKKEEVSNIVDKAKATNCDVKIIPSLYRFAKEDLTVSSLKDVEITDLLGRDEIKTNLEEVFSFIRRKTVLVTGAGGSIGSELVRQIAANDPKELILFDIYENSTYDVQLELRNKYPNLKLEVLIGSVRDHDKVLEVFEEYRPDIVYHAAAHKHVPLMEDSPNEAIKNNSFGTLNVAMAALAVNTSRFVLISTDKAVNPTNIMGASKRICEMIVQTLNKCISMGTTDKLVSLYKNLYDIELKLPKEIKTTFSAVRFGNVLGSNGSVVPIFKKQIEKGGPVTVTHKDITRYFMTIPEAVSLVLQCSVYAKGGEIFVLDMGEPVKISDLAKNLIKLSGKTLDEIKIVYTGLRPGEKLYEERLMDEEGLTKTENELISIGKPLDIKTSSFLSSLKKLYKKAYLNDPSIEEEVSKIVTTYKPKSL